MKERPILFSAPMVRALLAGTKTQTRRVVKVQPNPLLVGGAAFVDRLWAWLSGHDGSIVEKVLGTGRCPYGEVGDRLWVRETWAQNWNQLSDTRMDRSYVYRADGETRAQDNGTDLPWRPSIHMFRRASRITLEVTEVRIERLQDISEADAWAEGCPVDADGGAHCAAAADPTARDWYADLWEQINGAGSWAANPYVWCVSFRRVRP